MPRAKGTMSLSLDTGSVYSLGGAMRGFGGFVRTKSHIGDITNYLYEELSPEFNEFADRWGASTGHINHMYEWNMVGTPAGRLWKNVKSGRDGNRVVSFTFLPSKTVVPVPPELSEPGPTNKSVKGGHVFKNKAMVMEMGMKVTIRPKNGKWLAFLPTPLRTDDDGNPVIVFTQRSVVTPGKSVMGNFSTVWAAWWAESAPAIIQSRLAKKIESTYENSFDRVLTREKRSFFSIEATTPSMGKRKAAAAEKRMREEIKKSGKELSKR